MDAPPWRFDPPIQKNLAMALLRSIKSTGFVT